MMNTSRVKPHSDEKRERLYYIDWLRMLADWECSWSIVATCSVCYINRSRAWWVVSAHLGSLHPVGSTLSTSSQSGPCRWSFCFSGRAPGLRCAIGQAVNSSLNGLHACLFHWSLASSSSLHFRHTSRPSATHSTMHPTPVLSSFLGEHSRELDNQGGTHRQSVALADSEPCAEQISSVSRQWAWTYPQLWISFPHFPHKRAVPAVIHNFGG